MRKQKRVLASISFVAFTAFLAACGAGTDADGGATGAGPGTEPPVVVEPAPAPPEGGGDVTVVEGDERLVQHGLDESLRFTEPVTISVALWDRAHERMPEFAQSYWAQWVAQGILEEHNIIVDWVPVSRWDESPIQSTWIGAGSAPDIGYTFDNPMVTTFAEMGGIHNLYPILQTYRDWLPNLYDLLGENVYWNLDPTTDELWSLTGRLVQDGRTLTFIREDWLDTLNLPIPTSLEEFEYTLEAFRDNQDVLMPNRTRNLIPFQLQHDVGWSGSLIFESFIPSDITEREWFVHGFDDRRFHFEDAMREGSRVLNRWFHNDLLWNDFIHHEPGDAAGDDLIRLGYVGSMIVNWDMPFRPGDAFISTMRENVGPEANFIPIAPFTNDQGEVRMFFPNATDRFIFLPTTNDNVVASLLYLDWISRAEVREFLQFGFEGVHRETLPNGAIRTLGEVTQDQVDEAAEEGIELEVHMWPDHQFIPSLRNFDLTLTVNGIELGDPALTAATLSLGYPGIEPEAILAARSMGLDNAYWFRQVMTRTIAAEEGMSVPLGINRDVAFHNIVAGTPIEQFDQAWETLYQNYLNMGASAIIAEREQAWIEQFGDVDRMP